MSLDSAESEANRKEAPAKGRQSNEGTVAVTYEVSSLSRDFGG
jgi:hypothetical protein